MGLDYLHEHAAGGHTKVAFCVPTITAPFPQLLDALEAAIPLIQEAGFIDAMVSEVGNPYISNARNTMLRKALDWGANIIVFLDHDMSFPPESLLNLIQTEGDVVAGTYRFKDDGKVGYMGTLCTHSDGRPIVNDDGTLRAEFVPAGFLKITTSTVVKFMKRFPALIYGPPYHPYIDLFHHGAHAGMWYGEDYGFSRNWGVVDGMGSIKIIPDLDITHHKWVPDKVNKGTGYYKDYPGNFHRFLMGLPGGSEHVNLGEAA